jgi:hypothetical protein
MDNLLSDPLGAKLMESSLAEEDDEEKPAKKPASRAGEDETALPPEAVYEKPAKPAGSAKPAKKGRKAPAVREAPAGESSIDDILAMDEEPAKPKPGASESSDGEDLKDEEGVPAPASKKKSGAPKKAKEEVTLDELLLPGVPQQR